MAFARACKRSGSGWRLLAALAAIVIGAGLTFAFGFAVAERKVFPYRLVKKIDRRIEAFVGLPAPARLAPAQYLSALVRLDSDVGVVGPARPRGLSSPLLQTGGGLTSFGQDVLVLPYDGRVYAARAASEIRATDIVAPDNNRASLRALAKADGYEDYAVEADYLRYNDLLSYESQIGRGLIVSYTEYHPEERCYTNTLAKLAIDPSARSIDDVRAGPEDWTILHRTAPCLPLKKRHLALEGHMAGGRMAFTPPATLYLTSGDFHIDGMRSDPPGIAQDPEAEYGKVLAIDVVSGKARIVSSGHRNPQGIAIGRDGLLLAVEHGPRGGDELNLIVDGANYGWPLESYGTTYQSTRIPNSISFGRHDTFAPPVYSWIPSVAVSGLTLVDGFHAAWNGDLIVAALIDQSIYRLRLQDDRVAYAERIPIGARIRDVHQHSRQIVLWTDNQELIFLTAAELSSQAEQLKTYLRKASLSASLKQRLQEAIERCAECHSFAVDDHGRSPSLNRTFDDPIAATPFPGYSDALQAKGGRWTRQNLALFLADPQAFAPGTTMPAPQLGAPDVVDEVINYLEDLDQQF
jgi:aldose sugar dehydrogenase